MILVINMEEDSYQDQLQLVNLPSQPTLKRLCVEIMIFIFFCIYGKITPTINGY